MIDHVLKVAAYIDGALDEGFTTVRDAGGLEPAWAKAVEKGLSAARGSCRRARSCHRPAAMATTAQAHDGVHYGAAIPGLVATTRSSTAPTRSARAAREQLRRGATQIKLLASGGIVSPTDPFDSSSSRPARSPPPSRSQPAGTPTSSPTATRRRAIDIAIEAGVRSIEHGSMLEEATAKRMKEQGVFMVPTLQPITCSSPSRRWSLPPRRSPA